jgi:C4-dicarboxylate transporter DctM subunit
MDPILSLALYLFLFFGLSSFFRMPIAFAMGIAALALAYFNNIALIRIPMTAFGSIDSFAFLAIPFFLYAGVLMQHGGLASSLLDFTKSLIGRIRGSLGAVAIAGSMLFGALTGSAMACISAIGGIMIPEMVKEGYSKGYSAALCSAASFLGILIPPSVPGIMYGLASGQPIASVWLATLTPGIFLGILFIAVNYLVYARKLPKVKSSFHFGSYLKNIQHKTQKASLGIALPVIIFGGVYGGIFTPTEAGAVAVVYGICVLLGRRYYRKFIGTSLIKEDEVGFYEITKKSAILTATIALIIVFAVLSGRIITVLGISRELANFFTNHVTSPIMFLLFLNVLLLFFGIFMDINTSILITTPLILPSANALGIDPIHLGGLMILNLSIGFITPPFAASIFIGCKIADISFDRAVPHIIPFFLAGLITLLITTFWPDFILFLPNYISP